LYKTQFPTRAEDLYLFLAPDGGDAYLPVTFDRKLFNPYPWEKEKVPTVEEAWLAQEEIWLRREVFHLLQTSLQAMAKFKEEKALGWKEWLEGGAGVPVDGVVKNSPELTRDTARPRQLPEDLVKKGVKESRLFRSHDWEVNLLIEEDPADRTLLRVSAASTIKNINPSRRPLSLVSSRNEGLRLLIRQRQGTSTQGKPSYVTRQLNRIRGKGRLVPYGEADAFNVETKWDPQIRTNRDFELEEVFDLATSPIKRLEVLEIGENALPHRIKSQ